jgi:NAD(P)-dependent dehydrogenase (short-subunit alcohol dehydrogenase family)
LGIAWNTSRIPDLSGRVALVTGANSGIGQIAAEELAAHGASVLLACRDPGKGEVALKAVRARRPAEASVELIALDLTDLASVRAAAAGVNTRPKPLDLLVNNAGVMAPPRRETADGFELQLGTNHLGHFALTGLLLDKLKAAPAARVVTVTSGAHRIGRIDFDDLQRRHRYRRWSAYGQSKLANLLFALELQRRAVGADLDLRSMAAHPGYASTNLQRAGPQLDAGPFSKLTAPAWSTANLLFGQSPEGGALPTLYAATEPDLPGGSLVGPGGFGSMRGAPVLESPSGAALDADTASRLWEVSEELTGVGFEL